jgi:hypothetical protein
MECPQVRKGGGHISSRAMGARRRVYFYDENLPVYTFVIN